MRRASLIVLGTLLVAAAGACGDDDSDDRDEDFTLGDDAVVEYHFGDSSVPPEYHRSYTLTIRKDEVHVVVDSYGDILQDTTVPLPAEVWDDLNNGAEIADIGEIVEEDDERCSGGTSRSISIENNGESLVSSDFSVCDGNEGAAEMVDDYVQPVIDAIPDWDSLLA